MIEAKKRVAREVARRRAARAAIAQAREQLRAVRGSHGLSTAPPPAAEEMKTGQTELCMEELDKLVEERERERTARAASKWTRTGGHLGRMSREAGQTWQRGSQVVTEGEGAGPAPDSHASHFPLISAAGDSPLMYHMMRPGPTFVSSVATPEDSRLASSLSSGSACSLRAGATKPASTNHSTALLLQQTPELVLS